MQNSCISTKRFEETRTIHTKSEGLEIFMGSDTENVTDKLLRHFYKDVNVHKKHQMKEKVLNYYIIIFK